MSEGKKLIIRIVQPDIAEGRRGEGVEKKRVRYGNRGKGVICAAFFLDWKGKNCRVTGRHIESSGERAVETQDFKPRLGIGYRPREMGQDSSGGTISGGCSGKEDAARND